MWREASPGWLAAVGRAKAVLDKGRNRDLPVSSCAGGQVQGLRRSTCGHSFQLRSCRWMLGSWGGLNGRGVPDQLWWCLNSSLQIFPLDGKDCHMPHAG